MAAAQRQQAAVKGVGAGAENGVHSMGPVGGGHRLRQVSGQLVKKGNETAQAWRVFQAVGDVIDGPQPLLKMLKNSMLHVDPGLTSHVVECGAKALQASERQLAPINRIAAARVER